MITRFKKPKFMEPILTFVPIFSARTWLTSVPIQLFIAGICSNIISAKYSPVKVHIKALTICLSFFSLCL